MNSDAPQGPTGDDVAEAMRAALARTIARAPHDSTDWTTVLSRARHKVVVRRILAGSTCLAVVLAVVAFAATSRGERRGVSVVGSETTTTVKRSTVEPGSVRANALTFREVQGTIPFGKASAASSTASSTTSPGQASSCEGGRLTTPPSKWAANATIVLADRTKSTCYLLGPTLLTGQHVGTVEVAVDATTASWVVNLHFDNADFVNKVASAYMGRQIAIIVDGVVESAPTINPGITGNDVTIDGSFNEAAARGVAARITPSGVKVIPPPTPSADDLLLQAFSKRCAAVAPLLNLGAFPTTSMITAGTTRAMFGRAHEQVPASLANIDGAQRLALCEGVASTSTGATPTTVCPNGQAFDVGPTLLYAVDAKLQTSRLPGLQYLIPAGSAATVPPAAC